MYLTDGAEEILETMWIAIEEMKKPHVEADFIRERERGGHIEELARFIDELVEKGLVERDKSRLTLTQAGKTEARDTVRRHRLSERLFQDVLHIKGDLLNEAACKMEHILHKGIDENICTLLGHPSVCPHGHRIPEGHCCQEERDQFEKVVASLADLNPRQEGRIAYLHTADSQKLQKLMAMGVLPGKEIQLLQRFPSYVFQMGHSQYAVDQEMASGIFVRLLQNKM